MKVIVADVETTGFTNRDRIIEIAFQVLDPDTLKCTEQYESLVNPKKAVPALITQITGITNKMLVGQPSIQEVKEEIREFIDGPVLFIAHSAVFDERFCKNIFDIKNVLCTLKAAQHTYGNQESYKLGDLNKALDLGGPVDAHQAMADVKTTALLLRHIVQTKQMHLMDIVKSVSSLKYTNGNNDRAVCFC